MAQVRTTVAASGQRHQPQQRERSDETMRTRLRRLMLVEPCMASLLERRVAAVPAWQDDPWAAGSRTRWTARPAALSVSWQARLVKRVTDLAAQHAAQTWLQHWAPGSPAQHQAS